MHCRVECNTSQSKCRVRKISLALLYRRLTDNTWEHFSYELVSDSSNCDNRVGSKSECDKVNVRKCWGCGSIDGQSHYLGRIGRWVGVNILSIENGYLPYYHSANGSICYLSYKVFVFSPESSLTSSHQINLAAKVAYLAFLSMQINNKHAIFDQLY